MLNTCCFTGHRPEKLSIREKEIKAALQIEIQTAIADSITTFISGMARGVDLWAAQLVLEFKKVSPNIKLLCAVPYEGFERKWSPLWRQQYYGVMAAADYVKIFNPSFTYTSFQERNRWMVDHSDCVIAVYNGERGGTHNTIEYAKQQKVRVRMIVE